MTKEQTDKIMALIDALSKILSIEEVEEDSAVETSTTPYIQISELNSGDKFKFSGFDWILLGDEQGGKLAIAEKIIGTYSFDENGHNDWKKSSPRELLNSEFLEILKKEDLLPFTSDLTADDGLIDYGSSEDFVFLLSDALYRKYRYKTPKYNMWTWTITPHSTLTSNGSYYERVVDVDGSLINVLAHHVHGVAPAILLKPETLVEKNK